MTASAIFPLAVGNTWVYQEKLTAMHGTVTNQVASVTPGADGEQVIMKSHNDLSGIPHTATSSTFIVHPDGSISVPLTQVGSTAITVKSGSIVWPDAAQLASGQPHPSTLVVSINEAGHTLTEKAHLAGARGRPGQGRGPHQGRLAQQRHHWRAGPQVLHQGLGRKKTS